jgi:hypothetical protein
LLWRQAPFGDRVKALAELERYGQMAGQDAATLAERIIATCCARLAAAVREVFTYLNSLSVYTVSETLTPRNLRPEMLFGMGGPAGYFLPKLATELGLDYRVSPYAAAVI